MIKVTDEMIAAFLFATQEQLRWDPNGGIRAGLEAALKIVDSLEPLDPNKDRSDHERYAG